MCHNITLKLVDVYTVNNIAMYLRISIPISDGI